jgi:hypothetical protein
MIYLIIYFVSLIATRPLLNLDNGPEQLEDIGFNYHVLSYTLAICPLVNSLICLFCLYDIVYKIIDRIRLNRKLRHAEKILRKHGHDIKLPRL